MVAQLNGHALNPARPSSLKAGPARPKNRPGQEDVLRPRPVCGASRVAD